jgi:predicted nuclease with TOPRIM domain
LVKLEAEMGHRETAEFAMGTCRRDKEALKVEKQALVKENAELKERSDELEDNLEELQEALVVAWGRLPGMDVEMK